MATVLVVEADPGLRMYTQVIYRDAGHGVTCVGDADRALTMLATNRYDLAVVGTLPGETTGLQLVTARAELSIAARTRVVLHTDDPLAAAELELRNVEVELLPKPARPAELLALISLGSGLELV